MMARSRRFESEKSRDADVIKAVDVIKAADVAAQKGRTTRKLMQASVKEVTEAPPVESTPVGAGVCQNQPDVKAVISGIEDYVFKSRYQPNKFQTRLMEALRDYKITLETVISSRGYSIASITICKPQMNRRISKQSISC